MRNLRPAASRAARALRAVRLAFFGGWYFADGAKEAAPA
jgi:hypothetical protein